MQRHEHALLVLALNSRRLRTSCSEMLRPLKAHASVVAGSVQPGLALPLLPNKVDGTSSARISKLLQQLPSLPFCLQVSGARKNPIAHGIA